MSSHLPLLGTMMKTGINLAVQLEDQWTIHKMRRAVTCTEWLLQSNDERRSMQQSALMVLELAEVAGYRMHDHVRLLHEAGLHPTASRELVNELSKRTWLGRHFYRLIHRQTIRNIRAALQSRA